MGCDIHAVVESKDRNHPDFGWDSDTGECSLNRNYSLFGAMAGVRNHIPGAFDARGLPYDRTWTAGDAEEQWGSDAHTPSWLTLMEFKKAIVLALEFQTAAGWPGDLDYDWACIVEYMEALEHHDRDVRIVFWFDN